MRQPSLISRITLNILEQFDCKKIGCLSTLMRKQFILMNAMFSGAIVLQTSVTFGPNLYVPHFILTVQESVKLLSFANRGILLHFSKLRLCFAVDIQEHNFVQLLDKLLSNHFTTYIDHCVDNIPAILTALAFLSNHSLYSFFHLTMHFQIRSQPLNMFSSESLITNLCLLIPTGMFVHEHT